MPECHLNTQYIAKDSLLTLNFSGDINLYTIKTIWQNSLVAVRQHPYQTLLIDLDKVTNYDNAFVHLFTQLHETQKKSQHLQFKRSDYPLLSLYQFYTEKTPRIKPQKTKKSPFSLFRDTGFYIFTLAIFTRHLCFFIGELLCKSSSLKKYLKCWIYELYQCGPKAVPIITLIGLLLGVILSFQGAVVLATFGAQIYIVKMVVISLSRELAPIMTGFIVTGRSVAAFVAEIGTMTVNQEIDALQTMDIDKTEFITIPKVSAVMMMLPLLNLYMLLAGFVGCLFVFISLGYSSNLFYEELANAIRIPDLIEGLIKSVVFGVVIASIGCVNGLKARQGSTSVGMAATRSVVTSIVMIAVIDGIFAVIFYNLGV